MIGAIASASSRFGVLRSPVAPAWSVNPSLLSAPTEGLSTACDPGTYDGTQPIVASYQWQEAATIGGSYSNISGATSAASPVWTAGDVSVNPAKRCTVTLTGPNGITASYSTAGQTVGAASPPGSGTATVTWAAAEDTAVTGYKVYWGSTPWAETYNSGTISGRTTATYSATGLESGRIYFKLRPLFDGGEGEDYSLGYVDIA